MKDAKILNETEIDRASAEELRAAYRALLVETDALRERIKAGVNAAFDARRGQNLKLGGHTPYGYDADAAGHLRRKDREQLMIALILKLHAEKMSLRGISNMLTEQNFFARCGSPLQPKQVARIIRTHGCSRDISTLNGTP